MKPYYSESGITIYHGDSREVLPRIFPLHSVAVADPPYGVGLNYASMQDSPEYLEILIGGVLPLLRSGCQRAVITPGVKNMFLWPKPDHVGSFYYPAASGCNPWGFSCWQPILFYGKDPHGGKGSKPDSFSSTEPAEKNGHPCPKPIGQWKWLVKRASLPGETIIDPFMGSGTTLIAARALDCQAIGIEIEERYCEIAAKRLAQSVLAFGTANGTHPAESTAPEATEKDKENISKGKRL